MKAREDVTLDETENYVLYHVKETANDEHWVIKDFNRVRQALTCNLQVLCQRAAHIVTVRSVHLSDNRKTIKR